MNAGEGVMKKNPPTLWWKCKLVQPLWKTVWSFLKTLKIELSYDTATLRFCMYLEKNMVWKDACTLMFIAALFTIAKIWKQSRCPSTEEWIRKMWYRYTMEYYSPIGKKEIMPFAVTCVDLEIVILCEVSQAEEEKYHMITLICGIWK